MITTKTPILVSFVFIVHSDATRNTSKSIITQNDLQTIRGRQFEDLRCYFKANHRDKHLKRHIVLLF